MPLPGLVSAAMCGPRGFLAPSAPVTTSPFTPPSLSHTHHAQLLPPAPHIPSHNNNSPAAINHNNMCGGGLVAPLRGSLSPTKEERDTSKYFVILQNNYYQIIKAFNSSKLL